MDDEELEFKQTLIVELQAAGYDGVRITPVNLVAAADLVKQDEANAFLNGFGYLCLRNA